MIKKQEHTVEIRIMKNFNEEKCIAELSKLKWEYVYFLRMIQMPCGRCRKECF